MKVKADDKLKWVTFSLCVYEAAAILTGKVPTISKFSSRHKWTQPLLVGVLSAHFYNYDRG